MNNILTLPEDTVSFNAKLRFIHKSKDGTVKYPGEIRKMALRSDLKISAWVPIDPSRPMNEGNRRLQVLLPVEYKRHNAFSKADMDSFTLSPYDERIPAVVKNHVGYDSILGSSPRQPPPPQQNVQPPSITSNAPTKNLRDVPFAWASAGLENANLVALALALFLNLDAVDADFN
ncbi:hypothetical protein CKAH01_04858 [Colletotrichum kahawae]|uniref:Uncharacterized protein n=1 Tax=Colletotrichum kahawae TaxID=34407 RepID=A0AAE0D9U7_COLKA|nr:hypothetical protein CKAH01_04858 [Colletotrichum kahawae]